MKRFLSVASISRNGLLVVRRTYPFQPTEELIIVLRSDLEGLLTDLHVTVDYPTKNQMQLVIKRHFYVLDLGKAIDTCASLKKFPDQLIP